MKLNTKLQEHPNLRIVWIVCALGLFIDGYMLYISSITLPFISHYYTPSDLQLGLIQSSSFIGATLGAIIVGKISDKIGRRSLLIFNLCFFVVVALLSSLAWSVSSLIVFRFLTGVGVGMDYPICASYLTEMSSKKNSGRNLAGAMFANCLASPVGVLFAWIIFTIHPELNAWRWMFASCMIPAIAALIIRSKLPESQIWIENKRNEKKSDKEYNKYYSLLFNKKYIFATIIFSTTWLLMDIAYYGIGLFTPMILESLHVASDSNFLTSASTVIKSTLYVNIFVVIGAYAAIHAIQKLQNVRLQMIGFLASFAGLAMLAFSTTNSQVLNTIIIFAGFIMFNFFINLGPGITTYSLPAQFYPTKIRATGHGFAAGTAKFGAFLGTLLLPLLQDKVGIYITVAIIAGALFVAFILSSFINLTENNIAQEDISISNELLVN